LIESLLQLARLDAGQEQINKVPFDLAKTATESLELLRPLATERSVTLTSNLTSLSCLGDPEKITQVITNLVSNAIHYTPAGGEVKIDTSSEQALAILTVTDTGPGIAPEHLPHIFDRFYRVESSRSRDKGGSGLGLAISRAIVNAHGGTIEIDSTCSKGTKVIVRLPFSP
jgi:signal transduction histidine kinase